MSQRIVSLVPSATEILAGLLEDRGRLVGVTHECDYPEWVRALPRVVAPADPTLVHAPPAEVDRRVSEALARGESLYVLDEGKLHELEPDLIVTQSLCDVCTVGGDATRAAVAGLPSKPEVISLSAKTLADVFEDVERLGIAIGDQPKARRWRVDLIHRLESLQYQTAHFPVPGIVALEWTDPPWVAGHWIPEMIALAGGRPLLNEAGAPSRRVTWDEIADAKPDIVFVMCCGYDLERNAAQKSRLEANPIWASLPAARRGKTFAFDANALYSRPTPRLVEGAEELARVVRGRSANPATCRKF